MSRWLEWSLCDGDVSLAVCSGVGHGVMMVMMMMMSFAECMNVGIVMV